MDIQRRSRTLSGDAWCGWLLRTKCESVTEAWLSRVGLARPAHLLTATSTRPIKPWGVHIQRQARVTVGTFVSRLEGRVDGCEQQARVAMDEGGGAAALQSCAVWLAGGSGRRHGPLT